MAVCSVEVLPGRLEVHRAGSYTADMTVSSIRELLEREPFQPFRIRASNGANYEVRKPGLVVVMKSQILIAAANSDRYSLVPLLHVAGVEIMNNGHVRRGRRSGR